MSNPFKKIMGKIIPEPKEVLSTMLDKVFVTEEEKEKANEVIDKLKAHGHELQTALIAFKAQHRSLLVAGWRPFVGWVCGFALANVLVINPLLQCVFGIEGPDLSLDVLIELIITLLGLGTLRTVEKMGGKAS